MSLTCLKEMIMRKYFFTVDIEKAFDSVDHCFFSVLKAFGFGENFIAWVGTLLHDIETCVM